MKIESVVNELATVKLSGKEAIILNNALNEILHGIDVSEFQTRIGYDREDAEGLLEQFRSLFDDHRLIIA